MCSYSCNTYGSCSYGSIDSVVDYHSSPSSLYHSDSDVSYLVQEAVQVFEPVHVAEYSDDKSPYSNGVYHVKPSKNYVPAAIPFLEPSRGPVFVGELADIKDFVEQAFELTAGKPFPKDVIVRLLSDSEFRSANKSLGVSSALNVLGFAVNRVNTGLVSEIFIRRGELAQIMLTIGHELGHVLSKRLPDDRLEEAKAFSFQIAWMRVLKGHNIANLSTAIILDPPARNGVHDLALDFVLRQVRAGKDPLQLFEEIKDVRS